MNERSPQDHDPAAPDADAQDAGDQDRSQPVETEWQRRKRLAAVFGDVLPETTGDERGGDERGRGSGKPDDWYRAQRPPHHGG